MKKYFILLLCALLSFSIYGCKQKRSYASVRVVTEIDVKATGQHQTLHRSYTQGSNMSSVLNYLRLLDPYISVELDPETFRTQTYEIIVTYSDGNHTVYRQIHDDYFQENGGLWKRIDPKLGRRLQELLNQLPV